MVGFYRTHERFTLVNRLFPLCIHPIKIKLDNGINGSIHRRIIGFAVHPGNLDSLSICIMFNKIISGKNLSSDIGPILKYHHWKENLRILDIEEIQSLPYAPMSILLLSDSSGYVEMKCLIKFSFGIIQICNANLICFSIILMNTAHIWV
jgi:hypothetical protein